MRQGIGDKVVNETVSVPTLMESATCNERQDSKKVTLQIYNCGQ